MSTEAADVGTSAGAAAISTEVARFSSAPVLLPPLQVRTSVPMPLVRPSSPPVACDTICSASSARARNVVEASRDATGPAPVRFDSFGSVARRGKRGGAVRGERERASEQRSAI
jgi:hypothetical protein